MFKEGAKVVYPMYGAGIIEDVVIDSQSGIEEEHYVIRIHNGNLKIKIGASKV